MRIRLLTTLPGCEGHRVYLWGIGSTITRISADCSLKAAAAQEELGGELSMCLAVARNVKLTLASRVGGSFMSQDANCLLDAAMTKRQCRLRQQHLSKSEYLKPYEIYVRAVQVVADSYLEEGMVFIGGWPTGNVAVMAADGHNVGSYNTPFYNADGTIHTKGRWVLSNRRWEPVGVQTSNNSINCRWCGCPLVGRTCRSADHGVRVKAKISGLLEVLRGYTKLQLVVWSRKLSKMEQ